MIPSNCAWRVVVSMRSSKESSRFFSVEAVALPNLPLTFRRRERSKRGYAVDPLPYYSPRRVERHWSVDQRGPVTSVAVSKLELTNQ